MWPLWDLGTPENHATDIYVVSLVFNPACVHRESVKLNCNRRPLLLYCCLFIRCCMKKERSYRRADSSQLSVEFVTNRNGSMVNMRCADGIGLSPISSTDTKHRDPGSGSTAAQPRPLASSRPSTARVAPARWTVGPALLQGRRPNKRTTTAADVHVDWPNGPL